MIASAEQAEEERIMRDLDSLLCGAVAWARQRWPNLQHLEREDLEQSARCVLLTRIRAYDGSGRAQLWTYARPRVLGHLQDLARRAARRHRLVMARSADLSWMHGETDA